MPTLTAHEIRDANTRYHDVAAESYDAKWGIDFGEIGAGQVLGKVRKALGRRPSGWGRSLEIGSGTGYFTLHLMRAGLIEHATCSDISSGMLETLARNAQGLGLSVDTTVADAERLPFADETFDLVLGHAVLHHIPDLPRAFTEFARVLRPGGQVLFAGEPSRTGDRLAQLPKRGALRVAPLWRRVVGARAVSEQNNRACAHDHLLEGIVDVHAFTPAELEAFASGAGLEAVHVRGEELLANWFGWTNRTLEATAEPADVPWLWRQYAYRGYLLLQAVDHRLLESRLPPAVFYNLMVVARKPGNGF